MKEDTRFPNYRWEKGEVYWYFIRYKDTKDVGVVKVSALRDSDDLFAVLKIEKILTPKVWVGHKSRIFQGNKVSANELQGVGVSGPSKYFFSERELLRKIFE